MPVIVMAVFVLFTVMNFVVLERYREAAVAVAPVGGVHNAPVPHSADATPTPSVTSIPEKVYAVNRTLWPWDSMDDMVRALVPKQEWRPEEGDRATASRNGAAALKAETGCDVMQVPFEASSDDACIKYLTNIANWRELVPLPIRPSVAPCRSRIG